MGRFAFDLRWAARDLRRRWIQVAAIALVIAIGTGVFAGLDSVMIWRRRSYDASYELLHMHDLRVSLSEGSFVDEGDIEGAIASMEHPSWVATADERLILPTQVDASTGGEVILVPGRLVGVPVGDDGPRVDGVHVTGGRPLDPGVDGAVLDAHFASHYGLPPSGEVLLSGGIPLRYVGTGLSPEYYMVISGRADFMAEANFAVAFLPLEAAQRLSGHEGQVNDLVLLLAPGVAPGEARAELEAALAASLPEAGAEVTTKAEDPAHRLLYEDLATDAGTIRALSVLVLLAAAFAAFNLISRLVESQRRQIGVAMALGSPRRRIAMRPLLAAAEIAALGVLFGIGMGLLFAAGMKSALSSMIPLPVWETPLRPEEFVRAAMVGFLMPFLATAWPVWRAVRVAPVDAIRTGHLSARGGGLAPLLKRLPMPGGSLGRMPFRNVLRTPRRTVLTALGIAASLTVLVAITSALDTFDAALSGSVRETVRGAPERVVVGLTGFLEQGSEEVQAIASSPVVGDAETMLVVGSRVSAGGPSIDLVLQVMDLDSPLWHPTIGEAVRPDGLPGVVLARKAAEDLGVVPGGTVTLLHPARLGPDAFVFARTEARVIGVHPSPMRFQAYADLADAEELGLSGVVNQMQVVPARGLTADDVKRELFGLSGVAVAQEATAAADLMDSVLERFSSIFRFVQLFALLLALLIAFNAASINADERTREHATMMAFGVRVRSLLRVAVSEAAILGVLGSAAGVGLGFLAGGWMMRGASTEMPDVALPVTVSTATIVATLLLGVAAVAIAPLFTARKLRRMDVASQLRVME